MRVLFVAHDHASPPGLVGERFTQRGYEIVRHLVVPADRHDRPDVGPRFPEFSCFEAVVVLGAPWSVYDHARTGSWTPAELHQLRLADEAGVPVLGICFGGQLLATAHHGSVVRSPAPELGWIDVTTAEPGVIPGGPWFAWHFDRWLPPPGAREIACNGAASQAFTLRRNLAVQFHPEITPPTLERWLALGGAAQVDAAGLHAGDLLARTRAVADDSRTRAHALVDGFLDRVARWPARCSTS